MPADAPMAKEKQEENEMYTACVDRLKFGLEGHRRVHDTTPHPQRSSKLTLVLAPRAFFLDVWVKGGKLVGKTVSNHLMFTLADLRLWLNLALILGHRVCELRGGVLHVFVRNLIGPWHGVASIRW